MAHPIVQSNSDGGNPNSPYYFFLRGFRQKKPYNLNLTLRRGFSEYKLGEAINNYVPSSPGFSFFNTGQTLSWLENTAFANVTGADNLAYNRFVNKMHAESADLGTTLAEHKSARQMITQRSLQALGLATALVKRDFSKAYRIVGKPLSRRPQPRDFASLYLEWSWGWRPMIEDIGNAMETVVSPILATRVSGRAVHKDAWWAVNSIQGGSATGYTWTRWHQERFDLTCHVSMGAKIEVSNPNLALANRLGLTNPFATAWAVAPFSFVVDKYINIGQMLSHVDDFFGYSVTDRWHARRGELKTFGYRQENHKAFGPGGPHPDRIFYRYSSSGYSVMKRRDVGLVNPSFTFRKPSIGGLGEAVSYFSLLTQLLSKHR